MMTPEQCELLALKLGRLGGFVDMSYRLFPATRNSFSPNLQELGFGFEEIRLLQNSAELRFQIFPASLVNPLKKKLEDLRGQLRAADEGPFFYTGAPFLSHENLRRFDEMVESTREEIKTTLKSQMVDNYDGVRKRAREELVQALKTLLPRLGIENSTEIIKGESWFNAVFPEEGTLTGDFRLDVNVYNVHYTALLNNERFCRQIQAYIEQPKQISLFR